ncbi:MAG: tetratricopeptide repeat protein [Gemmatimonadota bacterium]
MISPRESLAEINRVGQLSGQGRYIEVLNFLEARGPGVVASSPTLALHFGIAHGRLGRHQEGARWVDSALRGAVDRGDRALQARALNVRGAIALEGGRIDEAEGFFLGALAEAKELEDHGTVGRCCNNLGIIANLRGQHTRAIASYTMALAAFQRAGLPQGVGETENNLRITYRDLGELPRALEAADRAVEVAERSGNRALVAFALGGRAEIRALAGEPELAHREIQRALSLHREVGDVVGEAEDLRVLALALAELGDVDAAEELYRQVIERAAEHGRPLLAAEAGRALAELLADGERPAEARDAARAARVQFSLLGAVAEVRRLDRLLESRLA